MKHHATSDDIDWTDQWATHCPRFREGLAHFALPPPHSGEILLMPGPGFGDTSHPTTQLVLDLMAPYVAGKVVFDIGSGSGVLSVAAAAMGAYKVYFCDIDQAAIAHTYKNGELNGFALSSDPPPHSDREIIILMNMIASEQASAWLCHHRPYKWLVTSGVLATNLDTYLAFARGEGWDVVETKQSGEWVGCLFSLQPSPL